MRTDSPAILQPLLGLLGEAHRQTGALGQRGHQDGLEERQPGLLPVGSSRCGGGVMGVGVVCENDKSQERTVS